MANNEPVVITIKKKSFFQKIKDRWNELDQETKDWLKIVGIWTVDGVLLGTCIGAAATSKQAKKEVVKAYLVGVNDGKDEAYLNMIQSQQPQLVRMPTNYVSQKNLLKKNH